MSIHCKSEKDGIEYCLKPSVVGDFMSLAEKIKVLLAYRKMNMRQLAEKMNVSQQSLSRKMRMNAFKENDLIRIAEICEATFEGVFTLNDTKKKI